MQFDYTYRSESRVDDRADRTALSFSPDLKREPTCFSGELKQSLAFREAISALHDVVVSDLRWKPKDKEAYKAWAAQQEQLDWEQIAAQRRETRAEMERVRLELQDLYKRSQTRMAPFYRARQEYYNYLYQKNRDLWFVLDPVITVHPDEIFFECFSQDEASYGRLGVGYEVFQNLGELGCGTTNIDYSAALYDEFQKIRSYKTTRFEVDPGGMEVRTTFEESYKEVKIDLPDSWVRGFLQVSSAMTLPAVRFDLHPMDVHNLIFVLRRHKEKLGPRGMRYQLKPCEPVRVVFEPWGIEVVCPRSIYPGTAASSIRVWGRRRLLMLERLIPVASRFTVHLLGSGMPSFYVADLGHMSFTLGLSGWTANDWSGAGNFDLMAPRIEVDSLTQRRVFEGLKAGWYETPEALAQRLGLDRGVVLGALGAWTQVGRAMFDLYKGVYRVRELTREPLPMDRLRYANEREESAVRFMEQRAVRLSLTREEGAGQVRLEGTVQDKGRGHTAWLILDADRRMIDATCTCNFYQQNRLFKCPCEHMLALRLQAKRQQRL